MQCESIYITLEGELSRPAGKSDRAHGSQFIIDGVYRFNVEVAQASARRAAIDLANGVL